ncbi:MAG: hypothetical protein LIR35_03890 [Bacteroidota bacterium]|nr:hypothetical protein [Bacteroidota bacterium]
MKKYFCIIAVLVLGFAACTKNESYTSADEPAAQAPAIHFSIPASFDAETGTKALEIGVDNIISTFASSDKVYVLIKHGDIIAMAHNGIDEATCLVPTDIDPVKGNKCTLEGELRFFCDDNGSFVPFEPEVDDEVYMFYNMNNPASDYPSNLHMSYYDYTFQNGSKDEDVYAEWDSYVYLASRGIANHDFAMAKMKVTGIVGNATDGYSLSMVDYDDETKSDVHFECLGAMFRQRLTFFDENGEGIMDMPTIKELIVKFEGGDYFVGYVWPLNPSGSYYVSNRMTINDPIISAEGDVYLALVIYDGNKDRSLTIEARDDKGNIYSVTKEAPDGGFQNGKYYYGSASMAWKKCVLPTVTGTEAVELSKEFTIRENPVNLTISGNSEGYHFILNHGGTVTLDNLTAQIDFSSFIYMYTDPAEEVSLVLTGDNSITTTGMRAIYTENSEMRLSCTGDSATLTLTSEDPGFCGFECYNYTSSVMSSDYRFNHYNLTGDTDVTIMLGADGFSVVRCPREENSDGSYTWKYIVTRE